MYCYFCYFRVIFPVWCSNQLVKNLCITNYGNQAIIKYSLFDKDQEGFTGKIRGHSNGIISPKHQHIYEWLLSVRMDEWIKMEIHIYSHLFQSETSQQWSHFRIHHHAVFSYCTSKVCCYVCPSFHILASVLISINPSKSCVTLISQLMS